MDFLVFAIPVVLAVFAGFVAYWLAFRRKSAALGGTWGAVGLFSLAMFAAAESASGWDGLTYAIILLFACAPLGVGLLIGSLVGWFRHRPDEEGGDTAIPPR